MITPKQQLVPANKHSLKCPNAMNAEYITFHNTANDASAQSEINYMLGNNNATSYHFAVDDKEVIQGILVNRNAWHCGDGNGTGNRKSIGVEVCYSKSGGERYKKAEALAIRFIAQLLYERNWGVDRVKPHKHWSGKNCPHRVLDEGRWNSVLSEIARELKKLQDSKIKAATGDVKTIIADGIKEGDDGKMKLELTASQWDQLASIFNDCAQKGLLSSQEWTVKAKEKSLTVSDAVFLALILDHRRFRDFCNK